MVILVPVIAGDSTIPKWVLANVPASRDRAGFTKQLRNQAIRWTLLCTYFCFSTYTRLAEQKFVLSFADLRGLVLIGLTVVTGCIVVTAVVGIARAFQARKWLDENERWPEIAQLQWYKPMISRMVPGRVTAIVFLLLVLGIVAYWNFLL
jgi:hypothetical protein